MNVISPITIEAAGARVRHMTAMLTRLADLSCTSGVSAIDRKEADRGYRVMDVEREALIDFIAAKPACTPIDVLTQIDSLTVQLHAMASEDNLSDGYKKLLNQVVRVFAGASGVLSNVAGTGLDEFTVSGLDEVYSLVFPLVSRSEIACADLGHS